MSIELKDIKYVYFIGIGGIGMSAIARWFHANGKLVAGYDKTSTPLTSKLEEEGITIHFEDDTNLILEQVKNIPSQSLVVYTPAVPPTHSELSFLIENDYLVLKRAAVLGLLTKSINTIAVAGTHGKTTTSTMVAHLLHEGGVNCTAFLGGISANFNSNLLLNDTSREDELWAVVEADEFDRSFLHLYPQIAVVTSSDADHLDIYGDKEALVQSFSDFVSQINENGTFYPQKQIAQRVKDRLKDSVAVFNYSSKIDSQTPIRAQNIFPLKDACNFDYVNEYTNQTIKDLHLSMPGFHNVENMTVAISIALQLGVSEERIKEAVSSFKGIKRRFEYIIKSETITYIDDYAHHPTEINALLKSVKHLYADRKITVIFQPHLFTRTRDFQEGFAESLSLADELILMDIYPARELPIEGVNSTIILEKTQPKEIPLIKDDALMSFLESKIKNNELDVLLTVGAGNIDRFVTPIKKLIENHLEEQKNTLRA